MALGSESSDYSETERIKIKSMLFQVNYYWDIRGVTRAQVKVICFDSTLNVMKGTQTPTGFP